VQTFVEKKPLFGYDEFSVQRFPRDIKMNQCASVPSVASWKTSHCVLDSSDFPDYSEETIIIVISSINPIKTKSMFFYSRRNRWHWLRRAERFAEKLFPLFPLFLCDIKKNLCSSVSSVVSEKTSHWRAGLSDSSDFSDKPIIVLIGPIKTKSMFFQISRRKHFDKTML